MGEYTDQKNSEYKHFSRNWFEAYKLMTIMYDRLKFDAPTLVWSPNICWVFKAYTVEIASKLKIHLGTKKKKISAKATETAEL